MSREVQRSRWKKAYETGISIIDAQHKRLFDLLGEVLSMVSEDGTITEGEVEGILAELRAYSVQHLQTEERIMEESGYAELQKHLAQHQSFVSELQVLMRRRNNDKAPILVLDILDFMLTWMIQHTLKSDMLFANTLKRKSGN